MEEFLEQFINRFAVTVEDTILQIIALGVNIYIAFTKKERVYLATFIFNAANLFLYMWIGETSAVVSYLLITVRSLVYLFKDKVNLKYMPVAFIILHVIFGILTVESLIGWLSVLAPCFTCVYMWVSKNEQQLRIGNMVNNGIWLVYNCCMGLWVVALSRVITIVANMIGYIKGKRKVL